jgi:Transposase DDE domain/Transposase domain (DUF772)
MRIHATQPLFAWGQLEDRPGLRTIREFLQAVPDQELLDGLTAARGAGRNDFPVTVLWGVVLLTALLRHASFEATLAELHRNPSLCRLLGITDADDIPHDWNVSRFLDVLGSEPHLTHVRQLFDALVQRLGSAVPDLGRHTAGDATHLSARARKGTEALAAEAAQGLPQPSGGKKEYKDADGNVTKVVTWFGYKLHLLVDVRHEVTLAYRVSAANDGDNEHVAALVEQATANLPDDRIETLAYDKAADDRKVHEALAEQGIKPVIQHQAHWPKDGEQEKVVGGRVPLNVVYDEAGTVHCYDTTSAPPVRQPMACIGYEKDRQAIKYRCPARQQGWDCPSDSKCNAGKKLGLAVRIDCTLDWRRFPPIPRATQQFERRYKGRTASERVHARLKLFWGADDGNVTGARRFHAWVGAVLVVHLGLALLLAAAPRWEGRLGGTRLGPIAQALAAAVADGATGGAGPAAAGAGAGGE